jgi:hypothetical protein
LGYQKKEAGEEEKEEKRERKRRDIIQRQVGYCLGAGKSLQLAVSQKNQWSSKK